MIVKSYEIKKNNLNLEVNNFILLYGENLGLKKDIKNYLIKEIKKNDENLEQLSFYENEIINNEEIFFNAAYSGSLFSEKKIITINESGDKIIKKINDIFERGPKNVFFIVIADVLEKKSKLRDFFEKNKNTICVPCYLDSEKDLQIILQLELKKDNITLSREAINLLIEKSNADRNNLRSEIEKIKSYTLNKKKIDLDEIKLLINFSGDYKSDLLINECLSGNILQYKKILSELYLSVINQILLLRILSNKIQRLLKIKEQVNKSSNEEELINTIKPPIFWKEKPIVKKQLRVWNKNDLKKIIDNINYTELLCKKNPQISNAIFFNFFSEICKKANSSS